MLVSCSILFIFHGLVAGRGTVFSIASPHCLLRNGEVSIIPAPFTDSFNSHGVFAKETFPAVKGHSWEPTNSKLLQIFLALSPVVPLHISSHVIRDLS